MDTKNSSHHDLKAIARCHRSAFPGSLSSKFGLKYCMKMLSFYLEDERGILFHIEDGGEVIGYCGGIRNKESGRHGSATSMTQHTFKSLLLNLLIRPWLIFHHEIRANIPLIVKNIKLRFSPKATKFNNTATNQTKDFSPSMGLVVIGLSPEHQGKGFGSVLLREFEVRAWKEGFKRIRLSVKSSNYQAIAAYKKNGWEIGKEGFQELNMFKILE